MGLSTLVELSPLYASLPTVLVSLTFINDAYSPWTSGSLQWVPLIPQNLFFGALTTLFISALRKAEFDDSDTLKPKTETWTTKVINNVVYSLIPLACLYMADSLLLPMRLVGMISIGLILAKGGSSQGIWVFASALVIDTIVSLIRKESVGRVLIGYVFLLAPAMVLLKRHAKSPDLNASAALTVLTAVLMLSCTYQTINWLVMVVAIGSLIVLTLSQVDLPTSPIRQYYKESTWILSILLWVTQSLAVKEDTYSIVHALPALISNVAATYLIDPDDIDDYDDDEKSSKPSVYSLLTQVMSDKDSRSIFNFLLLNLSFMFVQLLYSFRSKSLSLLSDSLHMFLDCMALCLGMLASVIAKNDREHASKDYPFGLQRIETLSGFTNGSLLLGIVFEIFNEATQRIIDPIPLEKTNELLVVSILGLLVNLVGMFSLNGEDGHGHMHMHSHTHTHTHAHEEHHHSHDDSDDSDDEHGAHDEHESHSYSTHTNENMRGIFLHIMADTLGSVGVVISTLCVKYFGWEIVDPITSILIASLILLSSFPLLESSSSNLLLSLDEGCAHEMQETLDEMLKVSGVKSYSTPRFWPRDGANSKLIGYLHVQYYRTESARALRSKLDRIIEDSPVVEKCYLQLENEIDDCWCRKKGIFSSG